MSPEMLALACDEEDEEEEREMSATSTQSLGKRSHQSSGENPGSLLRDEDEDEDENDKVRARISTTFGYGSGNQHQQPWALGMNQRACRSMQAVRHSEPTLYPRENTGQEADDNAGDDAALLHKRILAHLLGEFEHSAVAETNPRHCSAAKRIRADMSGMRAKDLCLLCQKVKHVLAQEPILLRLQAPIKVFGDLHGQLNDLLRYFRLFGNPSRERNGDIDGTSYLFLGDYVDRGEYSVDLILLLFSLKIEYPQSVYLLRGNHELESVNYSMGFYHECVNKFGGEDGFLVWKQVNDVFRWMSLGALVNEKVFCCHGGIGATVRSLEDIESLKKPIDFMNQLINGYFPMEAGQKLSAKEYSILIDLLWSDPAENETIQGCHENVMRGSGVSKFGADVVAEFCRNNNLDVIIRGHECVMDGFTHFASGRLITVFSATNYCGTSSNKGAILQIEKDLTITPKVIDPVPSDAEEPASPPTPFHSTGSSPFANPGCYEEDSTCTTTSKHHCSSNNNSSSKSSGEANAQACLGSCRVEEQSAQGADGGDGTSLCIEPPVLKRIKTST